MVCECDDEWIGEDCSTPGNVTLYAEVYEFHSILVACACVCVCVCVHARVCMWLQPCVCVCMHVRMHVYLHVCIYLVLKYSMLMRTVYVCNVCTMYVLYVCTYVY